MSDEKVDFDSEDIKPIDEKTVMTVAGFKRYRKRVTNDLNNVLFELQKGVIDGQVRINLVWNSINAIIRSLHIVGLITDEQIVEAGRQLMQEHEKNMEEFKAAHAEKRPPNPENVTKTPVEHFRDVIVPQVRKPENN